MNYEEFKKQILILTTIDLNAYKENQMKRRIGAIIKKNQCEGYDDYLRLLKTNKTCLQEFITYLTINVTEFFRNPSQWDILEKQIFPLLLQKKRTIKIWSAACSTGDEPYSLAMVLSKFLPLHQMSILATDLDREVLEKAQNGQYIARNLNNIPREFRDKYMTEANGIFTINEELKKCITFKQHNLLKDPYPSNMDLIVCRNVMIYFTEEAKKDIYLNFNKAMTEDGILFVGSTEQIIMCQDYGLEPYKIFFYQKKGVQR